MGGKTGTTSSQTKIPPEVLARYNSVNTRAEDVAAKPFQQYGTTPDAFVAQLNPQQQQGMAGMNQYANAAQPVLNQVQQGYTPEGFSQGVKGYMNPYLESAVASTRNQMQNVAGQQQAQMKGSAIGQGAFGGDRSNIGLGNLINQQNLALGQTIGGMESQGFQNAAQNYMSGLGQRGQTALAAQQAGLQGAQAQIGAGTLGQQTEQAGKTALYNQFLQEQAYPYQVAQFLANIAMGTGALSGSSTTTTQPMPFFSDERLKDDIEKIGKTFDGQDIIKFRYKGEDGPKQIGLSAQNVEKHHPEAVGLAKGYKTVDYDAATKDAAKRGHFEDGGMASEGGAVGLQSMGLGFAAGGGAYDPYDPYSIQNIIARQQGFFDGGERSHVPTARGLSGGMGKHGRVPEASLPVGRLMVGSPPPAPLESGMSQAMNAANTGETISKMFSTNEKTGESGLGRKMLDFISEKMKDPDTESTDGASRPNARGGLVGYASGGMPYDMDEDPKKLDIPDESSKFKMPEQKHLPGAMQDPTMKAIMDMAKLASGFMKNGGRAGYATDGAVDELGRYLGAIANTESGGQKDPYAALGPLTKKGDRGYGKYQVMGANIPSWTEEALGQKMNPDEYLANKDAQEKVARHYFGKSLEKYGNPEDAASVWFTGKPRSEAGNVADILGTTNSQYIRKFNEALGEKNLPAEKSTDAAFTYPGKEQEKSLGQKKGVLKQPHDYTTESGAYTDESQQIGPIGKAAKGLLGKDFPTSENLWVPALAGLGSMLSSKSPFFLPAFGEGLIGGTAAYTQLNQQQPEIAGKLAETEGQKALTEGQEAKTEAQYQDIVRNAMVVTVNRETFIIAINPDGTYGYLPEGKAREALNDGTLKVDPRGKITSTVQLPTDKPEGLVGAGRGDGLGGPSLKTAAQDIATGLGGAETPTDGAPTEGAPTEGAPTEGAPKEDVSKKAGVAGAETPTEAPKVTPSESPTIGLDDKDKKFIEEAARRDLTGGLLNIQEANAVSSKQMFDEVNAAGAAAASSVPSILDFAGELSVRPEKGFYAPGSLAPGFKAAANAIQDIAGRVGLKTPFDPATLGNEEAIKKQVGMLVTEASKLTDQTAFAALKQFEGMFPTENTTRDGAGTNVSKVLTNMMMNKDMRDAASEWQKEVARIAPNFAAPNLEAYSGKDFKKWFNKKYGGIYAQDQQALKKLFMTQPSHENGTQTLDETGQPMSWMRFIYKHGNDPKYFPTPESRIAFRDQLAGAFGKNVIRYFPMLEQY